MSSYTVDPNDQTTPTDGNDAEQGAEELRALKDQLNVIAIQVGPIVVAHDTWVTIFSTNSLVVSTECDYWVGLAGTLNFNSYGHMGKIYRDTGGPTQPGKIIQGSLADVRVTGTSFQYKQTSGITQDVYARVYGNKERSHV